MSDERPPLPDTDDPLVLLGVGDELDERAVKRAYARLIKRYRPERAPAEFARIQRAYEVALLRVRRGGEPADPVDGGAPAPAEAPIDRAADHDGPAAAPGPDEPAGGDRPAPARAPAERALVQLDALMTAGRHADAIALIDDDGFAAQAADEPVVALLALRALTVAAWRSPRAASALRRLDEVPQHPRIDAAHAEAAHEVRAAERLTAPGLPPLPAALLELLSTRRWVDAPTRAALERSVADLLDQHPDQVQAALDRLVAERPEAAAALADVAYLDAPARIDDVSRWPGPVRAALTRELELTAPREPDSAPIIGAGVAVVVLVVVGLASAGLYVAAAVVVGAAAAVGGWWAWMRQRHYHDDARRPVARTMIATGVHLAMINRWLGLTSGTHYARFLRRLTTDRGLELLGLIATLVRRQRATWAAVDDELEGFHDLPVVDDDAATAPPAEPERPAWRPPEVDDELTAAAVARLAGETTLPAALAELIGARRSVAPATADALRARLAGLLSDRPGEVMRALDRMVRAAPAEAEALARVLAVDLPPALDCVDDLRASVRAELDRRAGTVQSPRQRATAWMGLVCAASLAAGLMWLTRVPALMAAGPLAVVAAWLLGGPIRYRWHTRRRVAEILIDLGVTRATLTSWLARGRPSEYRRDARRMRADEGLFLLGLVAATVRDQRLCWVDADGTAEAA